jgi:heme-degrading monooxygenase HmoA
MTGGTMQHARIAMYGLTGGSFEEVAQRAEHDLLEVFRAEPGFRAYGVVRVDHTRLASISLWATEEQAYAAAEIAAAWVGDHLEGQVKLEASYIGDVAFWSTVALAESPATQTPIPT